MADFLFQEVPWLRAVLAWSIAVLAVLLILTIPAYFIFWPFFQRAARQLAKYLEDLAKRLEENRSKRAERLTHAADEFLKDGGLWQFKSDGEGRWSAFVHRLVRVLKRLRKPVGKTAGSLAKLYNEVSALQQKLLQSQVAKLQAPVELPESEEAIESTEELRLAWGRIVIVLVLLLGLMSVNTGMLSQILRDLGVVPAMMTFAGIPLAYIFALLLTLIEAGIGVAHGIMKRSVKSNGLPIWPTLLTLFALIVAFVEGFFYSRIADPAATVSLPFFNYEMLQSHLFFLWGFVLVMVLFTLGFIGYGSYDRILRGSKSRTLRREMNKLRKQHERYARAVKRSEQALNKAKEAAADADKLLQGPADNGESVRQELDRVWKQVEALKSAAPEWAEDKEAALTRTEVHHYALIGGVWLTFALLGVVLMIYTGLSSFAAFYPALERRLLGILAVTVAVAFIGVGFLLGMGETVVQGGESEQRRRVWAAPRFSRWLAYAVGGLLVAIHITLFFAVAWPMGLGGVWFLNLVIGLLLIAASYQLSPLFNVVPLLFRRLWNAVVLVLEALWLALIRLLRLGIVILENMAYFLAAPLDKVLARRREVEKVTIEQHSRTQV
jgi:uncharacterized protein YukE